MNSIRLLMLAVFAGAVSTGALAKVPEAQVNRLGQDLTPMGAEKAGTGDIPDWTGGLTSVPSNVSYSPEAHLPDPFADDAVLYTITAENMGEHETVLTDGYKALLSTYPSYKMNIYPSRRTCGYSDTIYEATKRNAAVGELVGGGSGISEAINGSPFPIANSGLEMMWNHMLRYRGYKFTRQHMQAPVTRSGDYEAIMVEDEGIFVWTDPSIKRAEDADNISVYYLAHTIAPARSAGTVILVHETINREVEPRRAWQYSPGTRRVRRAPNISYDNPGTNTDGLSTSDSFSGYNGSPDRYDWTVNGKSVKAVAYNNYGSQLVPMDELINPLHLNQDVMRYELHRVWEVEANLKPDVRHVYSRRVYQLDEDSWQITTAALFDGRGELWRVQELHMIPYYHAAICDRSAEIVYDLQSGRYLAGTLQNDTMPVNFFADELTHDRFTPSAIRQRGVR